MATQRVHPDGPCRTSILSEWRATFRPCPRSRAHRAPPPPGTSLVGRLPLHGVQVPPRTAADAHRSASPTVFRTTYGCTARHTLGVPVPGRRDLHVARGRERPHLALDGRPYMGPRATKAAPGQYRPRARSPQCVARFPPSVVLDGVVAGEDGSGHRLMPVRGVQQAGGPLSGLAVARRGRPSWTFPEAGRPARCVHGLRPALPNVRGRRVDVPPGNLPRFRTTSKSPECGG